jgi:hypothetical protein
MYRFVKSWTVQLFYEKFELCTKSFMNTLSYELKCI